MDLHQISPPRASLDGHFKRLGEKNKRVCIDQYLTNALTVGWAVMAGKNTHKNKQHIHKALKTTNKQPESLSSNGYQEIWWLKKKKIINQHIFVSFRERHDRKHPQMLLMYTLHCLQAMRCSVPSSLSDFVIRELFTPANCHVEPQNVQY